MGLFDKEEVKLTLTESIEQSISESLKIKSVFSKMKDDLEEKNVELNFKKDQLDEKMDELIKLRDRVVGEHSSNEKVVKNIDKIIQ